MKKAVIVHCWSGYPEYCWYPQTKKELEAEEFKVEIPAMPQTHTPKLSLWLPKLKETIGKTDKDLYLIGHSAGCITILRYLEQLDENEKVGGVVLVAGFTDDLDYKELMNFFQTPIDFAKIKSKAKKFVIIASDDDPYVPIKYADVLSKNLGPDKIIRHKMGHFSGKVDNSTSITSLPDVSQSILKLTK